MTLHIALFQPDIAGNTGTILRLAACLDVHVHIIEPAGFDLSDRNLRRAGMDYIALAHLTRHADWAHFLEDQCNQRRRLWLFTTKATKPYTEVTYVAEDVLLFGRESAGAPAYIHEAVDGEVCIPMRGGGRSLNLAVSVAMACGEALRQVRSLRAPSEMR
ncbi:tRNA (cytidine(34)-2'-O)-methyltransferase [Bartonella sp. DGB2]|uniref:tRNA (cytidine(34)-2'-O)-methyltransferase n=1 Tax=Bartonella sp. DGB2 TaxID=3388426 RepID=UPI00399005F3